MRNQSLKKQIQTRDVGLCRCCGFKGSEAHHIIPLIFGGRDNVKNMVWLCSYCHRDAPDNKQEFFEYMLRGGARTERFMGMAVTYLEEKKMDFHKFFPLIKQVVIWLKNVDKTYSLANFNLKDSLKVKDVDFTKELKEYNKNKIETR